MGRVGGIYRVCGLRLSPNFRMRLTAKKNFYLQLTVGKIDPFAVFSEKYLRSYGCMKNWNKNWNHRNIEVIGIKIYFIIKTIYLLFSGKLVSSHLIDLIDLVISSWLMRPLKSKIHWKINNAQKGIKNINVWHLYLIFPFLFINISRLSFFRFHKQPWSKIIVFL